MSRRPKIETVLEVDGLRVELLRKPIKNAHLRVYPPDGRIRLSVPERSRDAWARALVRRNRPWIDRQRERMHSVELWACPSWDDGEQILFCGEPLRLSVMETTGRAAVQMLDGERLELRVPVGAGVERRGRLIDAWYRAQMRALVPGRLRHWEAVMGLAVREWRIKRMTTRWGTCNPRAGRIWLNLELIKRPPRCLEYVLIHEMVHLLEASHNERFRALMDCYLPQWRRLRRELNDGSWAARWAASD